MRAFIAAVLCVLVSTSAFAQSGSYTVESNGSQSGGVYFQNGNRILIQPNQLNGSPPRPSIQYPAITGMKPLPGLDTSKLDLNRPTQGTPFVWPAAQIPSTQLQVCTIVPTGPNTANVVCP